MGSQKTLFLNQNYEGASIVSEIGFNSSRKKFLYLAMF